MIGWMRPLRRKRKNIVKALAQTGQELQLAGEKIEAILTRAPGNDAPIGGLKVTAKSGWFAARPSGTENIYKIYAESFRGADHLRQLLQEAQSIVSDALAAAPAADGGALPSPSPHTQTRPHHDLCNEFWLLPPDFWLLRGQF